MFKHDSHILLSQSKVVAYSFKVLVPSFFPLVNTLPTKSPNHQQTIVEPPTIIIGCIDSSIDFGACRLTYASSLFNLNMSNSIGVM
jgi:hypothetical protein